MQFDFSCVDWSDDDSSPFDQCEQSTSSSCDEPASCESSISSTRTSTVRFAQEDEVFEHLHLNEYSQEDINATWYRPHEFRQVKSQVHELAGQLEQFQRQGLATETEAYTMRGLEIRTEEGGMRRSSNKREAYAAVLEEQQRQWRSGRQDPDRIAAAYQVVSCKCQGMALLRGVQDAHDVQEFIRSSSPSIASYSLSFPAIESSSCSSTDSTSPVKPYEVELMSRRLAVLEDIKILSGASEIELWHTNPAAA
jgi:murein L,D-transpeptidase YcbB/YkuD